MKDEQDIGDEAPEGRKTFSRWLIVAILGAIAAGVLLASSVWDNRWKDDGNAVGNELVAADDEDKAQPEKWCAAQATYDLIRRELFRRAAQVRGSDEQAYARLADFALLRMNAPIVKGVDERVDSVTCSGTAVLGLPPGVAVAGGRRSLSGDVDYMVQPAADGTGNVVRIGNADSIVVPLATLSRMAAPQAQAPVVPELSEGEEGLSPDEETATTEQPAPPPQPIRANPSFDCGSARTRSEKAVCSDPGLAALDRRMASQFNLGMMEANREQRRLLESTRDRFLGYRDRCATNQCIAETYRSRMREISDIMSDRWRG